MSNKKQSSVEWFAEELKQHLEKHGCISQKMLSIHFNRAKAMHKEEIINSLLYPINGYQEQKIPSVFDIKRAEQYYNETFGGQDNE